MRARRPRRVPGSRRGVAARRHPGRPRAGRALGVAPAGAASRPPRRRSPRRERTHVPRVRRARGPVLHEHHYTTDAPRDARYTVAEWAIRPVFDGTDMVVGDFSTDPRYAQPNPFEVELRAGGVRAGLIVPLRCGGRVIGAVVATSLAADVYDDRHLRLARQVADHIAPAVENAVLRQRERQIGRAH